MLACKGRENDSAKNTLEKFQKHEANDTIKKKLLKAYDSLKRVYGDSLNYVSDIYVNDIETTKQAEDKIIDTISRLKEVIERSEYVRRQSNSQRHLRYMIWQRPSSGQPFYWLKVLENNGESSNTHFNFYVKLKPFQVFYYDITNDTTLDLETWRKGMMP